MMSSGRTSGRDISRALESDPHAVDGAWTRHLEGRRPIGGAVRDAIYASWIRSTSAGIDPQNGEAPNCCEKAAIAGLRRANRRLCEAAKASIARIGRMLFGTEAMLVLTDDQGKIVEAIGDPKTLAAGRKINLRVGGTWDERAIGTNGIGTALWAGEPMLVHGSEHFVERLKSWSCAAAPIRDPADGAVVGAVDLSGLTKIFREHNVAFAAAAAGEIEAALAQAMNEERIRLLDALLGQVPTLGEGDGVLVLDCAGRILHRGGVEDLVLGDGTEIDVRLGRRLLDPKGMLSAETVAASLPRALSFRDVRDLSVDGEVCGVALVLDRAGRASRRTETAPARGAPSSVCRVTDGEIVAESPMMLKAMDLARRVARVNAPVLVQGETGTGKELFARLIHAEHAGGRETPFVAINCGAIPRELVAGELFGHVEGAFTGAAREGRAGRMEEAGDGVLCLDEIGEMPLEIQPYLLRVLEERVIHRVGETQARPFAARLVALTNRDLQTEVEAGRFRRDLYYRIDAVSIQIPPLRERGDDVLLLAEHFNRRTAREYGQDPLRFPDEVRRLLLDYRWPGNVRELRNLVQRLHALATGRDVTPEALPGAIRASEAGTVAASEPATARETLQDAEKAVILETVKRHNGNLSRAAKDLGITRPTLYRRLKQYNIERVYR